MHVPDSLAIVMRYVVPFTAIDPRHLGLQANRVADHTQFLMITLLSCLPVYSGLDWAHPTESVKGASTWKSRMCVWLYSCIHLPLNGIYMESLKKGCVNFPWTTWRALPISWLRLVKHSRTCGPNLRARSCTALFHVQLFAAY